MAAYGGDEDIVVASVWIHDRYKPLIEGKNHAARAAEWTEKNLAATGYPAAKVAAVAYAVGNHANPPQTIPAEAKEARLLWDADKLGKLGAIMVVYMLCTCQAFPQNKVDFSWIQKMLRDWVEKGRELAPRFYFPLSRELGLERYNILKAFYEALEKETSD
jgi:HD superfamily phosphodiesterase